MLCPFSLWHVTILLTFIVVFVSMFGLENIYVYVGRRTPIAHAVRGWLEEGRARDGWEGRGRTEGGTEGGKDLVILSS
jgi:hypothetical protein